MRRQLSILPCAALILAAAYQPLRAEEPLFTRDFKLRTGYGLATKDNLRPASLSLGFNFGYALAAGRLGLEVGYFYKSGDQYIEPVQGQANAALSPVNLDKSGDSRRNTIEGLALRLSFERPIDEDWNWQAGLMIGGTKFKHEYVGDVEGGSWNADNPVSWRDNYYGTPTGGATRISPYAGVSYRIGDHSSLELNLLLLNYTALNYVHHPGADPSVYYFDTDPADVAGAGRIAPMNGFPADTLERSNRLVPHLEFGYIFHF